MRRLSQGDIEGAALLSNSPKRRFEVLKDYEASVGREEFKRAYSRLLSPQNPPLAEIAMGEHRLILWDLGEAENHVAAQYYVKVEGRFLMDDRPSRDRADLQRVLRAWRAERASSSGRRD